MRTGLYLRQSLDRTGLGAAVARQREDCETLIQRRGWQLTTVYSDNDVSASSGKRRPQYEALLDDLHAHRLDAVVAWSSDRLHRRLADLVEFVAAVNAAGALVATVKSGDIDLSTPHGRMLAGILGSVAQAEVEQKGLRQQRANQQRADAGVPRFTRRPYGYSADGLTAVAAEAATLRQVASAVLAGSSLREEVSRLNSEGVQTSTGGAWSVTSLRRVLHNPRMAGLNSYKGEIVGRGAWEPILDEATHLALRDLFQRPGRRTATTNVRKHLLSGLVLCGVCGQPMYASPTGTSERSWHVYRCRKMHNSRRLDLVDAVVEAAVCARLARPDAADLFTPDAPTDQAALREEAAVLRLKLDEVASAYAEGALTVSQLRTITAQLRQKLSEIEQQQARNSPQALDGLLGLEDIEGVWNALSLSRKRAVIDLLLTATVLPVGRGARFAPDQVRLSWTK